MANGIDHKDKREGHAKPHEAPKGTPPEGAKPKPTSSKDDAKK